MDNLNNENAQPQDVILVDSYNLIYRAFHGNQSNLTNPAGLPTNAIFTFCKMIEKLPSQFNNLAHAVAVFDGGSGTNFRKELDEEYKANRKPMPDSLKLQMPYIEKALDILGWPILRGEGVECDDVIGTLAVRAAQKGFNVYIISSDKDFRQLISDQIKVIDTMSGTCYDRETVKEKMGVYPENVRAYLALLGDGSDNVKGVDKVGNKTAAKLLEEYGDIHGLIANKDKISGKVGENIRIAIENGQLMKSFELVTLKLDVPVDIRSKHVTLRERDHDSWDEFCKEMNFKSFLNKRPAI